MYAIGEKFGYWKVLGEGIKPRTLYCECSCGFCDNIKRDVLIYNLEHKTSRGCGLKTRRLNGFKGRKYNEYKKINDGFEIKVGEFISFIDIEDYDKVSKYKWSIHKDSTNVYIRAYDKTEYNGVKKYIFLHNLIMDNIEKNNVVDHIDGDTLNNRKSNLRLCSQNNNEINKKIQKNNKSGYKGVWYSIVESKWKAYITYNNKRIHLGTFLNKEDAVKVRLKAENEYFKNFNRGGLNE